MYKCRPLIHNAKYSKSSRYNLNDMPLHVCKEKVWKNLCKMTIANYWFKAGLPHYTDENGHRASRMNAVLVPSISSSLHNLDSQLTGLVQCPGDRRAEGKVCCLKEWVNTASSGQPLWQKPLATELWVGAVTADNPLLLTSTFSFFSLGIWS